MPGCQGQTREHATHVPSTGSLVPVLLKFRSVPQGMMCQPNLAGLGGLLGNARAPLGRIACSDASVWLLVLLDLCLFFGGPSPPHG